MAVLWGGFGGTFNTADNTEKTLLITSISGNIGVCWIGATGMTAAPTLSDNLGDGGLWQRVPGADTLKNTSADGFWLFVRDKIYTSSTSNTITTSGFVAGLATGGVIMYFSYSGVTRTGTSAIRQTAKQTNALSGATPSTVFGSAPLAANSVGTGVFAGTNVPSITAPTGFTRKSNGGYSTPTTGATSAEGDAFTSATVTWLNNLTSAFCTIAFEMDGSAAAVSRPIQTTLQGVARSAFFMRRWSAKAGGNWLRNPAGLVVPAY